MPILARIMYDEGIFQQRIYDMAINALRRITEIVALFYDGVPRREELREEERRAPMTMVEPPLDVRQKAERQRRKKKKKWKEPMEARQHLSPEETEFIQLLQAEFQLGEEDLSLFYLVGFARQANWQTLRQQPAMKAQDLHWPDFTPDCLTLLMECSQSPALAARGYFAAMVYLKNHAPPQPPCA